MRHTLTLLGGRWKLAILWQLSQQPMRFTTLHGHLAPISEKVLAGQLKELEKDGLLTRTVHAQVPPKVEYALTELGYSLQPVLTSLLTWGLHKQAFDRGLQAGASK